jgi:cellulose biosynthesis protein BcsQ
MKSVSFFNNKGGVGKTTLSINIGYHLATDHDLRVLFVDCDPQCNSTQAILPEKSWLEIYDDPTSGDSQTILKPLRHIREGDSAIDLDIPTIKSTRFGFDILPGHPYLASVEDLLSEAWAGFGLGRLGDAKRTHWSATLVEHVDYDLVIFDLGPSLAALNRSVLIGTDGFVTPTSTDLFSLYSFDNLLRWFSEWEKKYERSRTNTLSDNPTESVETIQLWRESGIRPKYLGYTTQEYTTRSSDGKDRTIQAYETYKSRFPDRASALGSSRGALFESYDLGVVPFMFSMPSLAQSAHCPIAKLESRDGLKGAQFYQRDRYVDKLEGISNSLFTRIQESLK